jgi:hypothetical protein
MAKTKSEQDVAAQKTREFLEKHYAQDVPQAAFITLMHWMAQKQGTYMVNDGPGFARAMGTFIKVHGAKFVGTPQSVIGAELLVMRDEYEAMRARWKAQRELEQADEAAGVVKPRTAIRPKVAKMKKTEE